MNLSSYYLQLVKKKKKSVNFLFKGIPIATASYYATVTLDQARDIFRSDTAVPMPLIEERHRILNETGKILLEKFGGSFLNCVRKSGRSAQKLMHLIVENFPSYRDEAQFEVSLVEGFSGVMILRFCFSFQGQF